MIAHRDEIYSRPKRTWFVTEKEKKLAAKAAKVSIIVPFIPQNLVSICSYTFVFNVKEVFHEMVLGHA